MSGQILPWMLAAALLLPAVAPGKVFLVSHNSWVCAFLPKR